MKLDIVFVTYNSEKWVDNCIKSIANSNYNLKDLSLYFYDNNSIDETLLKLKENKKKYAGKFSDYVIISGGKNKGFGYGNNIASSYGKGKYILFLNIDTEIMPDTLMKLNESIKKSAKEVKMWELSQRPYEHPKYYDPITGYTSWASGACMVIERSVFEKLKGFDTRIFMYCEDVEISWNLRSNGYKIKYLFDNPIMHYSYSKPNEFKSNQFLYGYINNLYLRAKYGSFKNYLRGIFYVLSEQKNGKNMPQDLDGNTKKMLIRRMRWLFIKNIGLFSFINIFRLRKCKSVAQFINGLDYEINRLGAFYNKSELEDHPLVSILVRTCNRPYALKENLISLRNQSYRNIEIIIVEDGKNNAEKMIKEQFSDLNIKYCCTKKNVGRSQAGNIAMDMATGKYLNFLDDDDVFFPDHVETLVTELENNNFDIVFSTSFETKIDILSKEPYTYEVVRKGIFDFGDVSKFMLYKKNLYPIQSVMFKRILIKECGGLDTNMDALEDWDFWIRLSLEHSFNYINKTTSVFRTPYKKNESLEREKFLTESLDYLHKKLKNYIPKFSVYDWKKNNRD